MPAEAFALEDVVFVLELVEGAAGAVTIFVEEAPAAAEVCWMTVVPATAVVDAAVAVEPDDGLAELVLLPEPVTAVEPPVRYGGAATAVDGSTSAPVPQGMFWPSGSFWFSGAVVLPSAAAIVKRVVQVRFAGSAGVENW